MNNPIKQKNRSEAEDVYICALCGLLEVFTPVVRTPKAFCKASQLRHDDDRSATDQQSFYLPAHHVSGHPVFPPLTTRHFFLKAAMKRIKLRYFTEDLGVH